MRVRLSPVLPGTSSPALGRALKMIIRGFEKHAPLFHPVANVRDLYRHRKAAKTAYGWRRGSKI